MLDGMLLDNLDDASVAGDHSVYRLGPDLVQPADQDDVDWSGIFGEDLYEGALHVPYFCTWDCFHIKVKYGFHIELRDGVMKCAATKDKLPSSMLRFNTMNCFAGGAEILGLVVGNGVSSIGFTGKMPMFDRPLFFGIRANSADFVVDSVSG